LNEILKNLNLERIFLNRNNLFKKDNGITNEGLDHLKESLVNHKYLKEIHLSSKLKNNILKMSFVMKDV
jgi:hypothetical protein